MNGLDKKRVVEAALFISARELSLEEMGKVAGIRSAGEMKKIIEELKNEYEKNNGAVEIVENNEKYLMKIRNEYADKVGTFAQDAEISKGGLRVLSYVYMNKGEVLKSQVAKKLGTWIYPYVMELVEKNFLDAKKAGRTKKLVVTDKFKRYFATEEEKTGANK